MVKRLDMWSRAPESPTYSEHGRSEKLGPPAWKNSVLPFLLLLPLFS